MIPRLGRKYAIDVEVISKPRKEFSTGNYAKTGLPQAPAIMIDDDIIVKGCDIPDRDLEALIERRL